MRARIQGPALHLVHPLLERRARQAEQRRGTRLIVGAVHERALDHLEFESPQVRVELFREVARTSSTQAGTRGAVLFPINVSGEFVAAPALELGTDLLGSADAGGAIDLRFRDQVVLKPAVR